MISLIESVNFRQRCWIMAGLAHLKATIAGMPPMDETELLAFATNEDEVAMPDPDEIELLMNAIDECDAMEIQEKV